MPYRRPLLDHLTVIIHIVGSNNPDYFLQTNLLPIFNGGQNPIVYNKDNVIINCRAKLATEKETKHNLDLLIGHYYSAPSHFVM